MNQLETTPSRTRPTPLILLTAALILAGLGACQKPPNNIDRIPSIPTFTMAMLDAKARPFIDEATSAVPQAVSDLCSDRTRLFWLLLKDKAMGTREAHDYMKSIIGRRITEPLGKATAVYKCAVNADAAVGMTEDAALDILSRQLYASAGLAVETVCVKATMDSCVRVLSHCAPKLAASWGLFGTCASADGPFPIGDVVGLGLAIGGTAWCCLDLYDAYNALPEELSKALHAAISATIAQCRQEAASAL